MFVGYGEIYYEDPYRLLVMTTNKIVIAREIKWLNAFDNKEKKLNLTQKD